MNTTITEIPVSKLRPAKDNIRTELGDVTELAASITMNGLQVPLIVVPNGADTYDVVAGARRLAAARKVKLVEVPCDVRQPMTEAERITVMIAENVVRASLTPTDEARAFQRLVASGMSQHQVAQEVGVTQPQVSKRLSLLKLPPEAQKQVDAGSITIPDALELAKLDDPKRVKRVMARGPSYGGFAYAVRAELEEAKREQVHAELLADFQAKGVKVLTDGVKGNMYNTRSPVQVVNAHGPLSHVDARKHQKLGCRAVAVDRWNQVTELCTDPKSHPAPLGQKAAPRESADERRRRLEREEVTRATQARRAFACELVGRKIPRNELVELLASAVLTRTADNGEEPELLEFLGVEPSQDEDADDAKVLAEYLAQSEGNRDRAAVAVALRELEFSFDPWRRVGDRGAAAFYLGFLERQGYQPSDAERKAAAAKDDE